MDWNWEIWGLAYKHFKHHTTKSDCNMEQNKSSSNKSSHFAVIQQEAATCFWGHIYSVVVTAHIFNTCINRLWQEKRQPNMVPHVAHPRTDGTHTWWARFRTSGSQTSSEYSAYRFWSSAALQIGGKKQQSLLAERSQDKTCCREAHSEKAPVAGQFRPWTW